MVIVGAGCLVASILLAGCCGSPSASCPTHKIQFTQNTGCLNDGSFEFCIPADDPAALAEVLAIAPQTQCVRSSGRARCDTKTQVLCMVETTGMCRADLPDAMNDDGWRTVCDLAVLPFVREIVATWYE